MTDFSLRTRIFATFLVPAEVLVTDSESQFSISYSSVIVTMALSGLVFQVWARDKQTTDKRLHCLRAKFQNVFTLEKIRDDRVCSENKAYID